ncbi:MAG: hypothetical protein RR058_07930 [Oscillospiraceae bacterium]
MNNVASKNKGKLPLYLKIGFFAALFVVLVAANYFIDPGNIFHAASPDSAEMRAIAIVKGGENAENLDNFNERLVKRMLAIEGGSFDTVVLGSSRAALITKQMTGEDSFFNFSISGASLEEIVGIFGVYEQNHGLPKRVIISMDPWYLNDNFKSERFEKSLGDGYYHVLTDLLGFESADRSLLSIGALYRDPHSKISLFDLGAGTVSELFSVTYFQSAVQSLFSDNRGKSGAVTATSADDDVLGILRKDGSYSYPESYRNADLLTTDERAKTQLPSKILGLKGFDKAYGNNFDVLSKFVKYLKSKGVRVDIILPPLNPLIWNAIKNNHSDTGFFFAQEAFEKIAEEAGANICGTFDPAAANVKADDFYDGYHFKPYVADDLVKMLPQEKE